MAEMSTLVLLMLSVPFIADTDGCVLRSELVEFSRHVEEGKGLAALNVSEVCAEEQLCSVQLCGLLQQLEQVSESVETKIEQYEDFHDYGLLIGIVDELNNLTRMHEDMLTTLQNISEGTDAWQLGLINATARAALFEKRLSEHKAMNALYEQAEIWLLGVMFAIGITGNGLLLLIFGLNRVMRSVPNLMLMNLAVADTLSLVVNIPLFYAMDGRLNNPSCKLYQFVRTLCVGVSVYSVVTISLQRFLAVSMHRTSRSRSIWMAMLVWLIAGLIAVPHATLSGLKEDGSCYGTQSNEPQYRKGITLFDVVLLCITPVFLITAFSGMTVDKVKLSVRQMPGEAAGHGSLKRTRVLSSNVLLGLVFVFFISFVPFYVFKSVFVWGHMRLDPLSYGYVLVIVYSLIFVNSCLNPVALYVLSKKFRRYFNRYLLCGFRAEDRGSTDTSNPTLVSTSL